MRAYAYVPVGCGKLKQRAERIEQSVRKRWKKGAWRMEVGGRRFAALGLRLEAGKREG
jgi:hypothetical protein